MKPTLTTEQVQAILHAARLVLFPELNRPPTASDPDDGEPVIYRIDPRLLARCNDER